MRAVVRSLLILACLCVCSTAWGQSDDAPQISLESNLSDLMSRADAPPIFACPKMAFQGPQVSISGKSAEEVLSDIAKAHELEVFDIGDMKVLAWKFRFEPKKQFDIQEVDWYSPAALMHMLIGSLSPSQLKAFTGESGLHYAMLSQEQKDILAHLLKPPLKLESQHTLSREESLKRQPDLEEGSSLIDTDRRKLDSIQIEGVVLHAGLQTSMFGLTASSESRGVGLNTWNMDGKWFAQFPEKDDYEHERENEDNYGYTKPNKPDMGDLDCSSTAFDRTVTLSKQCTVSDLVDKIAKSTGLELYPDVAFGRQALITPGKEMPIRDLLEALSISIPCTWRKVGPAYVIGSSRTGCAGAMFLASTIDTVCENAEEWYESSVCDFSNPDTLRDIRFTENSRFSLSSSQLDAFSKDNKKYGRFEAPITYLTPEQLEECGRMVEEFDPYEDENGNLARVPEIDAYDTVDFELIVIISADIPGVGPVQLTRTGMYWGTDTGLSSYNVSQVRHTGDDPYANFPPVPADKRITLDYPVRGLLYAPCRGDRAADIVRKLDDHGMNTLYIRVFHDGYAAYPSKCVPKKEGLRDRDFLKALLINAHEKGIKVIGVIDVLRWADGDDANHWLYKEPEIIDLDALKETMRQSGDVLSLYDPSKSKDLQLLSVGEAFIGEFVSPFKPRVRELLTTMLDELADYDLDGLALDYTAIPGTETRNPDGRYWNKYCRTVGFNEAARLEFLRAQGADPLDIPFPGEVRRFDNPSDNYYTLAHSIVYRSSRCLDEVEARKLWEKWVDFQRSKADELLVHLVKRWNDSKPQTQVHLVDTYSFGEDVHDLKKSDNLLDVRLLYYSMGTNSRHHKGPVPFVLFRAPEGISEKGFLHEFEDMQEYLPKDRPGIVIEVQSDIHSAPYLRLLEKADTSRN